MTVTRLRQIVPALPPRKEGVGGYAVALALALRSRGIETIFASPSPACVDFESTGLDAPLPGLPTLLHYANYGYHAHGIPRALVESVTEQRECGVVPRLAVYFHEFVATGPPWRRTFWSTNTQRRLAVRLGSAADCGLTTIPIYENLLRDLVPNLELRRLAMPSPVGEPLACPLIRDRPPTAIVFGGRGNRASVYRALCSYGPASRLGLVTRFLDVGPDPLLAPSHVAGVPVEARGEVSAADLSALLLEARLGFAAYPADFLGKSTAFAALAAHGVPCLALTEPTTAAVEAPCLRRSENIEEGLLTRVGSAVRSWYAEHDLATHAEAILFSLAPSR